ncbi:acyltransferase, partial [Micromonospora zhanjiangensis]
MGRLGRLAAGTPAGRERYVDLLRAIAIVLVVLGHWLIIEVTHPSGGRLTGHSALDAIPWAPPLTWLFQVIPVFFLVGGYANAASLRKAYDRGGRTGRTALDWLTTRSGRLVRPTTVLIVVLAAAAAGATLVGAAGVQTRQVVWFATIPLWFLSAYLAVVLLTPVMYALHRRFGLAVPLVLVGLVGIGDLARFRGPESLADANFLFGWLAIHQVGFAWREASAPDPAERTGPAKAGRGARTGRDGSTRTRLPMSGRAGVVLVTVGLVALVLLTVVGPYPVSMLDLPGELRNSAPPTLALLATATFQLGVVVLLRGPAERWLRRPGPWRVVVGVNAVVLTIFLWHVSATILLVGLLDRLHLLPTVAPNTAFWWLLRLPWLAGLLVLLAGLVAVFGRIEARGDRRPDTPPRWLPAACRTASRT